MMIKKQVKDIQVGDRIVYQVSDIFPTDRNPTLKLNTPLSSEVLEVAYMELVNLYRLRTCSGWLYPDPGFVEYKLAEPDFDPELAQVQYTIPVAEAISGISIE